jgi:hypothetical protein
MTTRIEIEKRTHGAKGSYVAHVEGVEGDAHLDFTIRGPAMVSADHTEAPESMRGTGVAMALVERVIADARADGFKIIPLCPYVLAQSKRHPEWRDAIAEAATPTS